MKAVVSLIHGLEKFTDTGFKGVCVQKFLHGLLKIARPRAKRIDDNLKLVYPESDLKWRKNMRREIYKQLSWTVTEILALQKNPEQAFDWIKKVENREIIEEFLNNKRGVIYLTGHFGNWELLASWYAQIAKSRGHELSAVYQDTSDQDIGNYIQEMRAHNSVKSLSKNISVSNFVRLLKNGAHVAILNDVSGNDKMIVPFLGVNATNMPGPAVLSLLSGAPIVPVALFRDKPFEHTLKIYEPVKIPDKTLNHEERVKKIVTDYNNALSKIIFSRPELWFWLHNRWKNVNL